MNALRGASGRDRARSRDVAEATADIQLEQQTARVLPCEGRLVCGLREITSEASGTAPLPPGRFCVQAICVAPAFALSTTSTRAGIVSALVTSPRASQCADRPLPVPPSAFAGCAST